MTRFKLSTVIFLIATLALGFALFVQQRREVRLRAALAMYRNLRQEEILDRLHAPFDLRYADEAPLEDVIKLIRPKTIGPRLPAGTPFYLDPIGLDEAGVSLMSPVKAVQAWKGQTLRDVLQKILEHLGLAIEARYCYIIITSKASLDEPIKDADPYLKFRDVLK